MSNFDDFHAFKSTSGGAGESGGSGPIFTPIVVIIAILWIIGELFG